MDDTQVWDYDYDDEPPPPPPLKEWKKRDLRDEIVRLREREDQLRQDLSDRTERLNAMRSYAQANRHHANLHERMEAIFNGQGWRIVDMTMTVENPPPLETPTLNSLYVSTISSQPRGVLTLELAPCPPKPKELS